MKKALLLLFLIAPALLWAQDYYCLDRVYSSDQLESLQYYYDNDNRLYAYELDELTGDEPLHIRDTFYYDVNGDCIKIRNHQLLGNIWAYTWYIDYEYDANHNRISRENYNSFDNGVTFDLGGRYEYHYNADNQITDYVMYFVGEEFMRGTYSYDAQGRMTQLLETQNDPWGGSGWSDVSKTVYSYDSEDHCTRIDFYYYQYSWVLDKSYVFTYDDAGNTSIRTTYVSSGIVDRVSYQYDLEYPYDRCIIPVDPEEVKWDTYVNRPLGYGWEAADDSGNLVWVCDFIFDYIGVEAAVASDPVQLLEVYPNPSTDVINVRMEGLRRVEILDQNGRVVLTSDQGRIDVSSLAAGTYFVKAYNGSWGVSKLVK